MKSDKAENQRYMGSVKVGPKGQIVIPKEIREMFDIKTGDTLVLLADIQKGIAIERMSFLHGIADAILEGRSKDIYPEHSEADSLSFAKGIKEISEESEKEIK